MHLVRWPAPTEPGCTLAHLRVGALLFYLTTYSYRIQSFSSWSCRALIFLSSLSLFSGWPISARCSSPLARDVVHPDKLSPHTEGVFLALMHSPHFPLVVVFEFSRENAYYAACSKYSHLHCETFTRPRESRTRHLLYFCLRSLYAAFLRPYWIVFLSFSLSLSLFWPCFWL